MESEAARVTRTRSAPSMLIEPASTASSACLVFGSASPVSDASFTLLSPSRTTPSRGTCDPGRMRMWAPTATCSAATSCVPAAVTTSALSGRKRIKASTAVFVRPKEKDCMALESENRNSSRPPSNGWPTAAAPHAASTISKSISITPCRRVWRLARRPK